MAADTGTGSSASWWVRAYEGLNALVGRAHQSPSFEEQMRWNVGWADWNYLGATDQADIQAALDAWSKQAIEAAKAHAQPGLAMPVNPWTGKPWFIEGDVRPLRPVSPGPAPSVPGPTIPGPTVTTPPAVIEPGPRVVTGEVLSRADKVAYDLARDALIRFEELRKWGGPGSVGGALRLGAAIWSEFGAEIIAENAAKAEAAARRNEQLRKGPATRRQATAKRGKIKRPGKPPEPPILGGTGNKATAKAVPKPVQPPTLPRTEKLPVASAQEVAQEAARADKVAASGSANSSSSSAPGKARQLTRSELLGVVLGSIVGGKTVFKNLLGEAAGVLAATNPATGARTDLQTATGSGGAGNLLTQAGTAEGQQKCFQVCRTTGKRKKRKKRDRRVCVDKGSLTKLFKSTLRGSNK